MSDRQSPHTLLAALVAGMRRGSELQVAGREAEAVVEWDRVIHDAAGVEGNEAALLMATVMYSKAHLLLTCGQAAEAAALAAQAVDRLHLIPGAETCRVAARAQGVRRSALTQLDRHDQALAIDEQLVSDYGGSESFELRVCAGEALVHAIWTHGHRREEAQAIGEAQRLVALLGQDADPEHLVEISELLLSGAEKLNHRRIWRRASTAVSRQVEEMCDATLALAERVGGDLGQAVTLSAHLTRDSALVQQHRLRTSFRNRDQRPTVDQSALSAVRIVEDKAREAGSEERYLDLAMIRATTLAEIGRTQEALAALDELSATLRLRSPALKTAAPLAIKALRRTISSNARTPGFS